MDRSEPAPRCDADGIKEVAAPRSRRRRKAPSARADAAQQPAACAAAPAAAAADPRESAAAAPPAAAIAASTPVDGGVHQRLGQLTRMLHDALRELGYDKELTGTRDQLPDARDRLAYIARVTGEAAEKVLNAVDRARSVQQQLAAQAGDLQRRWVAVAAYAGAGAGRATPAGQALIGETCAFFDRVGGQADATNAILTDIMLAQDFHDLTGQVIRRVVSLAHTMEEQLVKLLIETTPAPAQHTAVPERLEGPVVNAARSDVVTSQADVDDLLASLGF